ncbi:unnamed protein product [Cylicocyclus nassatus]|uniref:MPN domain-containing protein n=1 Tax=Cylicocyclus nassatus TaxID=53992 RepID=A0AA36H2G7_CYLNA|nr:unnamed protein product [Cylicocyclus nassatus]
MDGCIANNEELHRASASERMANLLALGKAQKISNAIPIVRYYRSMLEVHRMALSYMKNQDLQRALVLLIRFCSFTIEELPKHAQYAEFAGEEKKTVFALLKTAFEHAERIKQELRLKFEQEAAEAAKTNARLSERHEIGVPSSNNVPRAATSVPPDKANLHITDPGVNTSGISYSPLNDFPNTSNAGSSTKVLPSAPPINRNDKPHALYHPSHGGASPIGNRTVRIGGDLVQKFLTCAERNTLQDKETCGTLCGSIEGDNFVVSHVIVPKQSGASDGCQAEGEEDIFAYQTKHDLLTLGWIHTHPSQTAFLSSVDLHTHCSYQMMLSEAVAIVCAPSHNQVGTFVMTPYGMSVVEGCTETGFHLHPEAEKLYEEMRRNESQTST